MFRNISLIELMDQLRFNFPYSYVNIIISEKSFNFIFFAFRVIIREEYIFTALYCTFLE